MITPAELQERLRYEPETGKLYWREAQPHHYETTRALNVFNAKYAGKEAGTSKDTHGYFMVKVCGQSHLVSRVAWAIHHGKWPDNDIDHKNRKRDDNRMVNLRDVTNAVNAKNQAPVRRKGGVRGVYWYKSRKLWMVKKQGKTLGYDHCFADAIRRAA